MPTALPCKGLCQRETVSHKHLCRPFKKARVEQNGNGHAPVHTGQAGAEPRAQGSKVFFSSNSNPGEPAGKMLNLTAAQVPLLKASLLQFAWISNFCAEDQCICILQE